jgi:bacterial/archaeal transporter family-2 protein
VALSRVRTASWGVVGLAFVVSMANALQSRVNGEASATLDHPVIAAMMSVGGGFVLSLGIALMRAETRSALGRLITTPRSFDLRPWQFFAGFGGGIFILGQALVVPAFGVSVYIIAVVAGQTVASLWVDHIGIGPSGKKTITVVRVLAALLATTGVIISAFGRGDVASVALAAVSYGLAAGAATAVQYALNGRIASATGSALVTSTLNFAMGFTLLTVVLIISTVLGVWELTAPPSLINHPYLWLGGPLGMLFIASAALFVKRLGVLFFAVVSVLGQLAGAILLDVFFPTPGTVLSWLLIVGLVVTAAGVLAATLNVKPAKDDPSP